MRWFLFIGSFLLGAVLMQVFMPKPAPVPNKQPEVQIDPTKTQTLPGKGGEVPLPAAENYVAPKDLSIEMQVFERAILYLGHRQEADGRWSAKNSGAAPEFHNDNGDVALTALSTYALLLIARGKTVNIPVLQRAKKGMDWLIARQQANGCIAAPDQSGEPTVAQLLACLALMQSNTMSARGNWKEAGIKAVRYAVLEMMNPEGGWGPKPKDPVLRADVNTLGVFVYRAARLEEIRFVDDNKDRNVSLKVEVEIEKKIKEGMKRLLVRQPPEVPPGTMAEPHELDNIYAASTENKTPDWDASTGGLLAQVQMLIPPSKTLPTVKFIYGTFDKDTSRFPKIYEHMKWGEKGEGYRALSLCFNTVSTMYLFGEQTFEFKTWADAVKKIVVEKQRKDGGWDVAGEDAKRGSIWRAALQAITATYIAPPPLPTPPPDQPPQPELPPNFKPGTE